MSSRDGERDDRLEKTLDHADSGAPAAGKTLRDRFSASEIFQRVVQSAEEEVLLRNQQLFFSGVAAGFAITLTLLAYAAISGEVAGTTRELVAPLLYPLGFLFIVVGNYQLFTENTLPPVTLVLTRLASVPTLFRVWGVVIAGNLAGVAVGAYVLSAGGVLDPAAVEAAKTFGTEGLETPWWNVFFKAIFAGWLVAGLVWLDHAMRDSVGRILLVYIIMFTVPAAGLFHVITAMADAMFVFFRGVAPLHELAWHYVLPVLLGNTVGGVVPVAVLNYGLTEQRLSQARSDQTERQGRLSLREWVFGGFVGRGHLRFKDE